MQLNEDEQRPPFILKAQKFEVMSSKHPHDVNHGGWYYPIKEEFDDYRLAEEHFNKVVADPETVVAQFSVSLNCERFIPRLHATGTLQHIVFGHYHRNRRDTMEAFANPGHFWDNLSTRPGVTDQFHIHNHEIENGTVLNSYDQVKKRQRE